MTEGSTSDSLSHGHELAPQLAPALQEACAGKLEDLRWFRSDWQVGGAATGYANYRLDGEDEPRQVVIKLPVGPVEYRFTTKLSQTDAPTPRVVAHGVELGGYDLAWMVMERIPGDPISLDNPKKTFMALADAAAAFYLHCETLGPPGAPKLQIDWGEMLEKARASVRDNELPEKQRWNEAVKKTQKALPTLVNRWDSRSIATWCHGDLHPGNAMMRPEGSPWGAAACVLIDLAETHPGHWVEDAVHIERLYWGADDVLKDVKPVKLIAKARKNLGLCNEDDYATLANVRRVLSASCMPVFLHREGHPRRLASALDVLERVLPLATP
ncbi:MAG: aminoglycoside phosphotransferase family protein [Phycisphaeraceae bacterium]|nr:MAG: aminoglycoside phosphotransferase family protein [Phycisphaeraceae bacterium]